MSTTFTVVIKIRILDLAYYLKYYRNYILKVLI